MARLGNPEGAGWISDGDKGAVWLTTGSWHVSKSRLSPESALPPRPIHPQARAKALMPGGRSAPHERTLPPPGRCCGSQPHASQAATRTLLHRPVPPPPAQLSQETRFVPAPRRATRGGRGPQGRPRRRLARTRSSGHRACSKNLNEVKRRLDEPGNNAREPTGRASPRVGAPRLPRKPPPPPLQQGHPLPQQTRRRDYGMQRGP